MLSDYLGSALRGFVDTYVTSFLSWDIIVFFHKNPNLPCDIETLAKKLGRPYGEIRRESDLLVDKGYLLCQDHLYCPNTIPELADRTREFYDALCDREKRLLILTAVLQKR